MITLGHNNENQKCHFYYVSILESIQHLLRGSFLKKQTKKGYLLDFNDAQKFKTSNFF